MILLIYYKFGVEPKHVKEPLYYLRYSGISDKIKKIIYAMDSIKA